MADAITLSAAGIAVDFEADCGFLANLRVSDEGAEVAPLHAAPWAGEAVPADAPAHLARLRGDFFCAPMGPSPDGLHGLTANGRWRVMPAAPGCLRAVLEGAVMGATVIKEAQVAGGHPFLYQRHLFVGGTGTLPVASHAMVAVPNGARLSFSRKRWFETLARPLEGDPARGRSLLACSRRSEEPAEFPAADGTTIDLTRCPWGPAHEDFVSAVEEPSSSLGWAAVVRPQEGDLFLSLKNPRHLPMTMLWHSNGGRDYPPWNGRHRGCLGVEEGAALINLGLSSHENPDPLAAAGQPGALTLEPCGTVEVRHVIGAIRWPSGQPVAAVRLEGEVLTVTGDWGAERRLPFRGGWLASANGPPAAATAATGSPDRDC